MLKKLDMKTKMNVFTKALIYTTLLGASTHLILLVVYALSAGTWEMLNAFDILDLELYMPQLAKGSEFFAASWLFIGVVYVTVLVLVLHQVKRKKGR